MSSFQGGQFEAMAQDSRYSPMGSGSPQNYNIGFNVGPFANSPLMQMGLQLGYQAFGSQLGGYAPTGLNVDPVTTMQNQRVMQMQWQLQKQMAEVEKENWANTVRGAANLAGIPYGPQQSAAVNQALSTYGVAMAPMLNQMMPDFMDQIAGSKGSAGVLASQMFMANRARFDPVTGQLGQDPSSTAAIAKQIYESMGQPGGFDNRGLRAGEIGQAYSQLAARGLIPGSSSPTDSLQRMGLVTAQTSPGEIDKLLADPGTQDKLRSMDGSKIKRTLEGYLNTVNTMRDIFGDMGKPNAPMSELMGALEALTAGSMNQIGPEKLNSMARMTYGLAKSTGVSMDNAMIIQQMAGQRAQQMGLEPIFGVEAMQGALSFGSAYQSRGLAPAWGAASPDQMRQLDANLRVGASASIAAQRMGVAIQMSDTVGGFKAGSGAANYVAALKRGDQTFIDDNGQTQFTDLGNKDWTSLLTGAVTADHSILGITQPGASANITAGLLQSALGNKAAVREYVANYNLGDQVRGQQHTEFANLLNITAGGFLRSRLGADLGNGTATSIARAMKNANLGEQMLNLDPEVFRDAAQRDQKVGGLIYGNMSDEDRHAFDNKFNTAQKRDIELSELARGLYNASDTQSRRMYSNSALTMFDAMNPKLYAQHQAITEEQARFAQISTELAPLNRGTIISRAMGFLQQIGTTGADNSVLLKGAASALGMVDASQLDAKVMPFIRDLNKEQTDLATQAIAIQKEKDPSKRAALQDTYNRQMDALRGTRDKIMSGITGLSKAAADEATDIGTATPEDLGRKLAESYGMKPGPTEADKSLLAKIGMRMKNSNENISQVHGLITDDSQIKTLGDLDSVLAKKIQAGQQAGTGTGEPQKIEMTGTFKLVGDKAEITGTGTADKPNAPTVNSVATH